MSNSSWLAEEGHPPLELLLLHLEGELHGAEAAAVSTHAQECWVCRTECERLKQGIFRFTSYYETAALPPPPPRANFGRLLRELAANPSKTKLTNWRLPRPLRHPLLGLGLSLAAAAMVFLSIPPLDDGAAAEFLRHARHSSRAWRQPGPRRVACQKVRFQHGSVVVERTLYRGDGAPATSPEQPGLEMKRVLDLARIDWQDPLNVDDFIGWWDSQQAKRDSLTEAGRQVTLTTAVFGLSSTRQASFTVAASAWRPVGRRVEFRGQPPLEITEIGFEIRDITPPAVAPPASARPRGTNPDPEFASPESDLDEAELKLREAFHELGADVRGAPEISRTGQRVLFRVFAETPERREEILRRARQIPLVAEAPAPADAPRELANTAPVQEITSSYSTRPPLAKALQESFGGVDASNRYIDLVRDGYLRLLAECAALERLGKRYPPMMLGSLSAAKRARVERIAADHVARIQRDGAQYLQLASPVFDWMPAAAATLPRQTSCASWQEDAGRIAPDLRHVEKAFIRLFVQDQVEHPVDLSAQALLAEFAQSRAALQSDLQQLCPPGK